MVDGLLSDIGIVVMLPISRQVALYLPALESHL